MAAFLVRNGHCPWNVFSTPSDQFTRKWFYFVREMSGNGKQKQRVKRVRLTLQEKLKVIDSTGTILWKPVFERLGCERFYLTMKYGRQGEMRTRLQSFLCMITRICEKHVFKTKVDVFLIRALMWLQEAYSNIPENVIRRCFVKSNCLPLISNTLAQLSTISLAYSKRCKYMMI